MIDFKLFVLALPSMRYTHVAPSWIINWLYIILFISFVSHSILYMSLFIRQDLKETVR